MKLPPAPMGPTYETSFSNDRPSRICVHELALAIARVIYGEDALAYSDVSLDARNDAHSLILEIADLPKCPAKGAPGVEA